MTTKNGSLLTVAVMLLVLAVCGDSFATENDRCVSGDRTINRLVGAFRVSISGYHDPSLPVLQECRVRIRDARQHMIFSAHEHALRLVTAGEDVNGDGIPDLVLEGDSGGNHGDYTYYVISLSTKPGLFLKFTTGAVPAKFGHRDDSGHVTIQTWDGAFFMFGKMAAAFSPYPIVYLRIDGTRLVVTSERHKADYDKAIRSLRNKLSSGDFARFKDIDQSWRETGEEVAASTVLKMSLYYLYSAREEQAHAIIREMWPEFDQQRIWNLMLKTRDQGLLKQVSNPPLKK